MVFSLSKKSAKSEKQWDRQCILERSTESLVINDHQSRRAEHILMLVSLLTLLFVIVEMVGGCLAHSLAIMTDAFHMLSDFSSFLISILAIRLSRRPATTRHAFGFQRAEVLGALSSILVIWVLTGVLLYMAVWRIIENEYAVEPDTMMLTAGIGVIFNLLIGGMLHLISHSAGGSHIAGHSHSHFGGGHSHGHHHQHHHHAVASALPQSPNTDKTAEMAENGSISSEESTATPSSSSSVEHPQNLNIRAAFVHVLGDLVQSLGVLVAAIVIKYTGFALADPICTFLFSILVLLTTVPVFGDTLTILMEASPHHVDHQKVFTDLMSLPDVVGVHSLRVWALKTDTFAATVHLELAKSGGEKCSADRIVAMAQKKLAIGHRIRFATVQTHCVLLELLEKQGELVEENAKTETGKSQEKGGGKGEKF